ncbi:lycopene cyclase family protein [Poritiphilus flavus]|uniref:NAD(P)-binding domain-containing protein n=1 Tax=Poritiphilus flavus TaxID=2697053 RepID=A0A6L9E7S3_9FLAO|nr:lycopene cyclase family protein [Poritiphilus flavus]NAS10777.1 NAD(P)-binding domain-containing protein [Poritiphilus flavus]
MADFDYIIIGAGAAGLMLADALGSESYFSGKSILLLDKDEKKSNDRTWCFWETAPGKLDKLVHKSWPDIIFKAENFSKRLPINPYYYKMIRGSDFYSEYFKRLQQYNKVSFSNGEVLNVSEEAESVVVRTTAHTYTATQVFNSIFDYNIPKAQHKYPLLQQHFIGWFIKTDKAVFDKDAATFMDFSIAQKGNTRFMYVLPFAPDVALVEYTLFSEELLEDAEYEHAIQEYLKADLGLGSYEILDKEKGNIPMTVFDFTALNSNRILNIGIAGGWAKASTGFTFMNTRKKVAALVDHLKAGKAPGEFRSKSKFRLYDMLLLDVLHRDNQLGSAVFRSLFQKRDPRLVLKFLDEDTNLWEDLKVITACPTKPFLKALLKRLF